MASLVPTPLIAPTNSHILHVVRALSSTGWTVQAVPIGGILPRNGLLAALRAPGEEIRVRIFVYKVTGSGRSRPDERRIEITSTYQKGLARKRGYEDVVLGYDADAKVFVGVDPRRLHHGGPTGNASSFFDRQGLAVLGKQRIKVLPRGTRLFGAIEFHAFFKAMRIAEYLFNRVAIHSGTYRGTGRYSGKVKTRAASLSIGNGATMGNVLALQGPQPVRARQRVRETVVSSFERDPERVLRTRKLSPAQLAEIQRRMGENGLLGEKFAMDYERRRLRRLRRPGLAARVHWVSQETVSEGYDIRSYEEDGSERWIEVKSTSGKSRSFEMSDLEWRTCCTAGRRYWIYRVYTVRTAPTLTLVRDPHALDKVSQLKRTPVGWKVTLEKP